MKTYYCWRCAADMPFLDDEEWRQVAPLLDNAVHKIKEYRRVHACDLRTAKTNVMTDAARVFETLTGMPNVHFETIYHHRLGSWGPECGQCGHLLRSPQATFCANCGELRPLDRSISTK